MSRPRKTTDIKNIKDVATALLYIDPVPDAQLPFILIHPYFENTIMISPKGKKLDLTNPKDIASIQKIYEDRISKSNSTFGIMSMIRLPYHFTFLKYAKPYMSKAEFDWLLGLTWTASENPNQDANVSINQFIKWFTAADKKKLMQKDDYDYYMSLPEEITIYRGVAIGRAAEKGLSWTTSEKTARWFANRFNTDTRKGYLISGKINKSDVLAYFNTRNENELLCNSRKIFDLKKYYELQ